MCFYGELLKTVSELSQNSFSICSPGNFNVMKSKQGTNLSTDKI